MRKISTIVFIIIASFSAKSQNETDALRYSLINYSGTARFNSMGGAFTSLGADATSIIVNPAAIGVYQTSELNFSFGFNNNNSTSSYNGNEFTNNDLKLNFSNFNLLGNFNASSNNWISYSVALGYSRLNNFNSTVSVDGISDNTILDNYINELNSNGGTPDSAISEWYPFSSSLAYETWLVNPKTGDSLMYNHVLENSDNISQNALFTTRGGMGETYFAFGGNYSDQLYVGASIGFPTIRYVYESSYYENTDDADTLTTLKELYRYDYLRTTGMGVNFKLGMIFRVTDWFRVGASWHSPTYYSMNDKWYAEMHSAFKDGSTYKFSSPRGEYDYKLYTPMRFNAGMAFVIFEKGVISADYEFVDYASARLRNSGGIFNDGYNFATENSNIANYYQSVSNFRIGTEWRLEMLRLRGGFQYNGNPLNSNFSSDLSNMVYSGGIGIKKDEYYLDLSYAYTTYKKYGNFYTGSETFLVTSNKSLIQLTLGFRY